MIIYYRKKNVSNEYLERLIDCNKIHRVSKYVYFVTLENFNPQKFWRLFLGKYRSSSIRENSLPVKLNFFPVVRCITYARTNMTGKQSRLKTSLSRFEKEREGEGELLNPSMRFPKVFRNVRVAISKIRPWCSVVYTYSSGRMYYSSVLPSISLFFILLPSYFYSPTLRNFDNPALHLWATRFPPSFIDWQIEKEKERGREGREGEDDPCSQLL